MWGIGGAKANKFCLLCDAARCKKDSHVQGAGKSRPDNPKVEGKKTGQVLDKIWINQNKILMLFQHLSLMPFKYSFLNQDIIAYMSLFRRIV